MTLALAEGRRVLTDAGVGVVVFAHKSTSGWGAMLQAMLDAGWVITASWPIDTEREGRLRAIDSAALASSVHLVCRAREESAASDVGDWRDVLLELPKRIHEWMPRLQAEGVVDADAIFACLGPALEIFSRYPRVEKPNGDQVTLKEYLEYVWAAVSKGAISMIFEGADTTGFDIHLILDNYSTHKSAAVQRWLKPRKRRRFHFHFTPTSGSWLNQVERFFGLITDKMIRRGTFLSADELERAIYAGLATWNEKPKAFVWKTSFSTKCAAAKKRL